MALKPELGTLSGITSNAMASQPYVHLVRTACSITTLTPPIRDDTRVGGFGFRFLLLRACAVNKTGLDYGGIINMSSGINWQ